MKKSTFLKIISHLFRGIWIGVIAYIALKISTPIGIVLGVIYGLNLSSYYLLVTQCNRIKVNQANIKGSVLHLQNDFQPQIKQRVHDLEQKTKHLVVLDCQESLDECDEELPTSNYTHKIPSPITNGDGYWNIGENDLVQNENGIFWKGEKIDLDPLYINTFEDAITKVSDTLQEDEELRNNYIANLSQCFIDSYNLQKGTKSYMNQKDVFEASQAAAERFLKILAQKE